MTSTSFPDPGRHRSLPLAGSVTEEPASGLWVAGFGVEPKEDGNKSLMKYNVCIIFCYSLAVEARLYSNADRTAVFLFSFIKLSNVHILWFVPRCITVIAILWTIRKSL